VAEFLQFWTTSLNLEHVKCDTGTRIDVDKSHLMDNKNPKVDNVGSRAEFGISKFWDPSKFRTNNARNFKFGTRINLDKSHLMDNKILIIKHQILT